MSIKGGIATSNNDVELSISIGGGRHYKRVYNDVVSVAINKFNLISTTLSKMMSGKVSQSDIKFYIDQIKILFQRAHVELLHGKMAFHDKYNMWLLDGYVRMLLEVNDFKRITQLLDIDSILYSIEEENIRQNMFAQIDFDIPSNITLKSTRDISQEEIAVPMTDDVISYIHSLNHNIILLNNVIEANKESLALIYKNIISTASKYLN